MKLQEISDVLNLTALLKFLVSTLCIGNISCIWNTMSISLYSRDSGDVQENMDYRLIGRADTHMQGRRKINLWDRGS